VWKYVWPHGPVWLPVLWKYANPIILVLGLLFIGLALWDLRYGWVKYPPFKQAYKQKKHELGRAEENDHTIELVSYDVYEKAKIIWKNDEFEHLVLSEIRADWLSQPDPELVPKEDECKYFDLPERIKFCPDFEEARKKSSVPIEPPVGGILRMWLQNKNYWQERVGWRRWGYVPKEHSIRSQKFKKGMLIGPLPVHQDGKPRKANIFALFSDKKWVVVSSSEQVPLQRKTPCNNGKY
jgi:hypothetical protein